MSVRLYELSGLEDRRYSLFSWRARLALAHKQVECELVPVRVSDKAAIAFSKQDKVPVLRDGDEVVVDSWRIAEHLEDNHPGPSLFGCPSGRALAQFVASFVDRQLVPKLVPILMAEVMSIVDAVDGAHEHDDFQSFVVSLPEADSPEVLLACLQRVTEAHGVLRMKGFAAVRGKPMRLVVQGVGARFRHHFDRPWAAGEARAGRIVVIGEAGLDRRGIEAAMQG